VSSRIVVDPIFKPFYRILICRLAQDKSNCVIN